MFIPNIRLPLGAKAVLSARASPNGISAAGETAARALGRHLGRLCYAALLSGMVNPAAAQSTAPAALSTQPLRVIVPFLHGEHEDRLARMIAVASEKSARRQWVVENRPGNSGHHGAEVVARAKPDGGMVLFAPIAYFAAEYVMYKLHYELLTDFTPVTLVCNEPQLLVTHPSLPPRSVGELIAFAKAQPGQMTWGTHRENELPGLQLRMLRRLTGIVTESASHRDSAMALSAMMEGRIASLFDGIAATLPHLRAGKLRALATSGAQRALALPQVPTMAQAGVKGFEADYWYAVLAPEDTNAGIVAALREEFVKATGDEAVRKRLLAIGVEATGGIPADVGSLMRAEIAKWTAVAIDPGAKPN